MHLSAPYLASLAALASSSSLSLSSSSSSISSSTISTYSIHTAKWIPSRSSNLLSCVTSLTQTTPKPSALWSKAVSHAASTDTVEVIMRTMCLLQDQALLTTSRVSNDDFDWSDMLSQTYPPVTQCQGNSNQPLANSGESSYDLPPTQSNGFSFDDSFVGGMSTYDFSLDDKNGGHVSGISLLESGSSNFGTPATWQGTASDVFSTPNTVFSDLSNVYGTITSADVDQHLAAFDAIRDAHIQGLKTAFGNNPNVLHCAEAHIDLITAKLCTIRKCHLPACSAVCSPQQTDHTDGLFAMFLDEKEVSKMIGPLENKISGLLDVLADAIKSRQGAGGNHQAPSGTLATPKTTSSPRKKATPVPSASRKRRSPSKSETVGGHRARHAVANVSFSTGSPRVKRARTDTLAPHRASPSMNSVANMGNQVFNGPDMYKHMASAMLLGTNNTSNMPTDDIFSLEPNSTMLLGTNDTSTMPETDLFGVDTTNALGINDFEAVPEDNFFNMDEYLDTSMFDTTATFQPTTPAIATAPKPATPTTPTMSAADMANFYTQMAAALTSSPPAPTNVDLHTHLAAVLAAGTNHAMPADFYKNMVANLAAAGDIGMTDAQYKASIGGACANSSTGSGWETFMGAGEDVVGAMQLASSAKGVKRARLA